MHTTFRRTLLLGTLLAALMQAAPAGAAQNLGGCQLDGLATLTPGLTLNQGTPLDWGPAFTYSFHGDLLDCVGVFGQEYPGGGAAGSIHAGEALTIEGTEYEWPAALGTPSGNGGCTGSHTDGTALIVWAHGTFSVIDYSTEGAAAGIGLTGQFGSETVTLASKAKNADGTPVSTRTIEATDLAGNYAGGPLVFHPEDPTQCNGSGVTEAPITGFLGHGNYA